MHIISTNRLDASGLSDKDAEKIAKHIIMVEKGKKCFIDEEEVKDPEPLMIKDMGYCKVALYCKESDFVILCPHDKDF